MKNLKLKTLSLGIVSSILISSSAFAATPAVIQNHPVPKVSAAISVVSNATKSNAKAHGINFGLYMTAQQAIDSGFLIQEGDTGEPVADIQRRLGVYDDGIFGEQTRASVINFQVHHGIPADGIIGPETWSYMK